MGEASLKQFPRRVRKGKKKKYATKIAEVEIVPHIQIWTGWKRGGGDGGSNFFGSLEKAWEEGRVGLNQNFMRREN